MAIVETIEQLESIYGVPGETSTIKVADRVTPEYRKYIEASPFVAIATSGPEGLDCSPRGDAPGFIRVANESTLHLPDRRGNNRADSLRNIIHDPRISLLFLVPGSGNMLRVNGGAEVSIDPALCESFSVEGAAPRSVIVVTIAQVYFQCARAIVRADLWNPARFIDPKSLPTPGQILSALSDDRVGGDSYDREWPDRAKKTLW